jgi:hypothetical protein
MAMQCFVWGRHWIFKYNLRETQASKQFLCYYCLNHYTYCFYKDTKHYAQQSIFKLREIFEVKILYFGILELLQLFVNIKMFYLISTIRYVM